MSREDRDFDRLRFFVVCLGVFFVIGLLWTWLWI